MSTVIERLPNVSRGERTIFSISGPTDRLPVDQFSERHREMLRYWSSKARQGGVPRRSDIDPLEIPRLLPNILLWDATEEGEYVCRLSGSEVDVSMGVPMKGCRLSELQCPLIDEAVEEFDAVFDAGMTSFAERTMGWLGKPYLYYRHLLVPLADDSDRVRMLMSLITFHPISELH